MGNKAHRAAALAPGVTGIEGLDRENSDTTIAGGGGGQGAGTEADDSTLHFEHTFDAELLEPTSGDAEAEAALLLSLPMPKADGPGTPTHHLYPPGHKHPQRHPPLVQQQPPAGEGIAAFKRRAVQIVLVEDRIVVEEEGAGAPHQKANKPPPVLAATFAEVSEIWWDHQHSSVKLLLDPAPAAADSGAGADEKRQYILALPNSLSLEQEVKARVTVLRRLRLLKRAVPFQYIGMFAGPTKPKPFQRKRATLSSAAAFKAQGAMPTLDAMKEAALRQYQGAAVPVPTLSSRRLEVALQHIHKGHVSFPVLRASHVTTPGGGINDQAVLRVDYEGVQYIHDGFRGFKDLREDGGTDLKMPFSALASWEAMDEHPLGSAQNGVVLRPKDPSQWVLASKETAGESSFFFQVRFAADARHVLEFFWNAFRLTQCQEPMPGSTHGRIVEETYTLSGGSSTGVRPALPKGSLRITDAQGRLVCDLQDSTTTPSAPVVVEATAAAPAPTGGRRATVGERKEAQSYWGKLVLHQGWLLKKGGFSKKWIWRYFVLYKTCMGHLLCYYADHTETALYTEHPQERNVIDCCKVEFIRPVSATPETPPHAFDVQSVIREWTVCASDQADLERWLRLLAYAVDADVAVLPDDEVSFMVKPRHDPTMKLYLDEYSTCLRIHSYGITVDVTEGDIRKRVFLWPYTDLYKWTILSQKGKIALQLTVFTSDDYTTRTDFIFRTRKASRIASVIEFFLEKFMCVMRLRLELPEPSPSSPSSSPAAAPQAPAKQLRVASMQAAVSSISTGTAGGAKPPSPMYQRESSDGGQGGEDGEGGDGSGGSGEGDGGNGDRGGQKAWASDGEEGEEDDRQADFMEGGDGWDERRRMDSADEEGMRREGSGGSIDSAPPTDAGVQQEGGGIDPAAKAKLSG